MFGINVLIVGILYRLIWLILPRDYYIKRKLDTQKTSKISLKEIGWFHGILKP